ncbi:MAG TPA: hypothetical protein VI636_21625 [Candidatus Angelobacter sp.]
MAVPYYALSQGEKLSSERMRELTARADADKLNKAKERLSIAAAKLTIQEAKKEKL